MSDPMPSGFQPSEYRGQAPRRRHRTRNTILAVIAAFVVIGGIASALDGSPDTKTSAAATAESTPASTPTVDASEPTEAVETSDPVDTTASLPTTDPVTTSPPKPKVLLELRGTGIMNTKPFETTEPWTLKYSFDCSNFGSEGNFAVIVADNSGTPVSFPVNALAASGNTSTQVYETGTVHLEINSECVWHVTAVG